MNKKKSKRIIDDRIKYVILVTLIMAAFCCNSCGKAGKKDVEEVTTAALKAGTVQIYHVEGTSIERKVMFINLSNRIIFPLHWKK